MDRILSEEQYAGFTENEFLADPFFQEWVTNPTAAKESFWRQFLNRYPQKRQEVESARNLLEHLSFKEDFPSEQLINRSLQKHLAAIEAWEEEKVVPMRTAFNWRRMMKAAAIVGGVVLMGIALLLFNQRGNKGVAVVTDYGELDSLLLPDNSKVVLNAHSKIRYNKAWRKGGVREVWLEGEAFFDVRHLDQGDGTIEPHERFVVHTNNIDVEVLGTSFNIRERRGKTEVVLQTGSIRVHLKNGARQDVVMSPGDMVTYNPAEQEMNKAVTRAEDYTAWKERKLILHHPSVNEIVAYLEDIYGKRIILQTAELGKRQLDGPILLNNLEDALFILSTVYDVEVVRRDEHTIVLRSRK